MLKLTVHIVTTALYRLNTNLMKFKIKSHHTGKKITIKIPTFGSSLLISLLGYIPVHQDGQQHDNYFHISFFPSLLTSFLVSFLTSFLIHLLYGAQSFFRRQPFLS